MLVLIGVQELLESAQVARVSSYGCRLVDADAFLQAGSEKSKRKQNVESKGHGSCPGVGAGEAASGYSWAAAELEGATDRENPVSTGANSQEQTHRGVTSKTWPRPCFSGRIIGLGGAWVRVGHRSSVTRSYLGTERRSKGKENQVYSNELVCLGHYNHRHEPLGWEGMSPGSIRRTGCRMAKVDQAVLSDISVPQVTLA